MTRLRVLCLHGYTSSASRLQRQLAPVAAALEPYAQFIFVDGPFSAPPGHAWWDAKTAEGVTTYDGWLKSRWYLHSVFHEQGPFDGILGFSQGAILSSVLVSLWPEFMFDFAVLIGGFKARDNYLATIYDGEVHIATLQMFRRHDLIAELEASGQPAQNRDPGWYVLKFHTPSLHVYGRGDEIVKPEASEKLAQTFENPSRLVHE